MSTPLGRNVFQRLYNFKVRKWFTKEIPALADDVVATYRDRNEIPFGGITSVGASVTTSVMQLDISPYEPILFGLNKTPATETNADMFATAGTVGQAIFVDGSDATGITLGVGEKAHMAIIVSDSDGSGGSDTDDNGGSLHIAVVAGTATTYAAATDYPSSQDIQDALDASTGVHDGTTGWAWLATSQWDQAAGPGAVLRLNRNNVFLGY